MKQLLLIRHAKSSWKDHSLKDIDRPLNSRGERDAPFMASYCRLLGLVPDAIISSPAKRAYMTASFFYNEFANENKCYDKETELYFGSEEDWEHLINQCDEAYHLPAYFSHNPTITYFANTFTQNHFDNIPTCGIIHLTSTAQTWSALSSGNTSVKNFYFPKLIDKS